MEAKLSSKHASLIQSLVEVESLKKTLTESASDAAQKHEDACSDLERKLADAMKKMVQAEKDRRKEETRAKD